MASDLLKEFLRKRKEGSHYLPANRPGLRISISDPKKIKKKTRRLPQYTPRWFSHERFSGSRLKLLKTLRFYKPRKVLNALRVPRISPEQTTGFEVGPGYIPSMHLMGLKRVTFIEPSRKTLEDLREALKATRHKTSAGPGHNQAVEAFMHHSYRKRKAKTERGKDRIASERDEFLRSLIPARGTTRVILQNARAHEASLKPRTYHIGLISEVLTHVPPSEREKVVRKLAEAVTHRLVIIDRMPQVDPLTYLITEDATPTLTEKNGAVDPQKLKTILQELGFRVRITHDWPIPFDQVRFILVADRK